MRGQYTLSVNIPTSQLIIECKGETWMSLVDTSPVLQSWTWLQGCLHSKANTVYIYIYMQCMYTLKCTHM